MEAGNAQLRDAKDITKRDAVKADVNILTTKNVVYGRRRSLASSLAWCELLTDYSQEQEQRGGRWKNSRSRRSSMAQEEQEQLGGRLSRRTSLASLAQEDATAKEHFFTFAEAASRSPVADQES